MKEGKSAGLEWTAREASRVREAGETLTPLLPQIMDAFTEWAMTQQEAGKLLSPEQGSALTELQTRHWKLLLQGRLDTAYVNACEESGRAHAGLGMSAVRSASDLFRTVATPW